MSHFRMTIIESAEQKVGGGVKLQQRLPPPDKTDTRAREADDRCHVLLLTTFEHMCIAAALLSNLSPVLLEK